MIVTERGGSEGVDTAIVRLHHAGLTQDNANDLRLFDGDGKPVAYEVVYHDPQRDALLRFRTDAADAPGGTFHLYFGNADAPRDPHRVRTRPPGEGPPGPGPAGGDWIPRAGLVLATHRRPVEADNPQTVEEMRRLLADSPGPDGAGIVGNIRHGLNPFGDSDHYLSIYRGWIELPEGGTWGFATASNEASFSFLDGNELIHWPGRHTEKRGERGQMSAEHELDAGRYFVEYLHEEVLLYQVAFLGWKKPGGRGYTAIPDNAFVQARPASVVRYEQRGGTPLAMAMPHVRLVDSLWPERSDRDTGQYTRYRFTLHGNEANANDLDALADWTLQWRFGDGAAATGPSVEHVYLSTGPRDLELHATSPVGEKSVRRWPVNVFPVEHLAGPFEEGDNDTYAKIVERYGSGESLDADSVVELAHFHRERRAMDRSIAAAEEALRRNDLADDRRREASLLAAGRAGLTPHHWLIDLTRERAKSADAHLSRALDLSETPARAIETLARRIRVVGIDGGVPLEQAVELYAEAEKRFEASVRDAATLAAFREATIALGDAALAAGETDTATEHYRRAERLANPVFPPPVRAAKTGAMPERIAQRLGADQPREAAAVAHRWLHDFPADMVSGKPLLWLGRTALARGEPERAVRPLRVAVKLSAGALHETRARWWLAEAHRRTGDRDAYRRALKALAAMNVSDPYRERAVDQLQELQP